MTTTAIAVRQYKERFPNHLLSEINFHDEITLEVSIANLRESLFFFKQTPQPGYEMLMDLTAVDYLKPIIRTKVVYWLHNPNTFARVRIVAFVARDEQIPSVTDIWAGADWYERELFDLFGIHVDGHPDLQRILMPDDWQGHPLRKDYPLTEERVDFKFNAEPKIPSRIICVNNDQKMED